MQEYTKEILTVRPEFDFEVVLGLLEETRLGGKVFEDLTSAWERWLEKLKVMRLDLDSGRYLVVWLDKGVEDEVDRVWKKSASDGFRLNCLAQAMCMCAVYQVLPEVEGAGCAPAPKPNQELEQALRAEGIPYLEPGGATLNRRFSVLTNYPFRGACDICYLQADCPKAAGNAEAFHSIELPGNISPDILQ